MYVYNSTYTVEPPGHFEDNINSDVVSFNCREVVLSSEVQYVYMYTRTNTKFLGP